MQNNKLSSLVDSFESGPASNALPDQQNKLSSLIDDLENDKVSQLKANISASTSVTPEQATKQYQISQQTKIPVDVVRTQENQIKQKLELNSINYQDLINNYPKTAQQLSNPNKVAAIRDDVDNLGYFEKVFGSVKQEYKTAKENVTSADLLLKQMAYDVSGNEKSKLSPLEENQLALIEDSQAKRKDYGLGFISSIPSYTAAAIPTILSTIPQTLGGAAVGAATGAAITKSPAGATAGATWGSRAGTVYATGKLEAGLAYKELKDLVDENGKPIEKQVAAGGAIATGIVNGLIELVPFEAATGQVKKAFSREGVKQAAKSAIGREYLKNIGKLALAEGAAEGFQELSSVAFSEVAKAVSTGDFALVGMKDANDTEGFYKFLSDSANRIWESTKAGAGAGLGLGGATGGVTAAKQVYDQRNKGKEESSQITDTVDKIKESKVFKRDPELFKEVTKDTLGEQNVYMPAEQVQTFFQTKTPEEIEQFYQAVPEAKEQIQTALETGGDLVLPANSALTAIAQNPSFTELQKYMSLSPESMTEQQAQDTFLANVSDTVNFEQKNQKEAVGQEAVKNNIKNQILDLNLPKNEAQNVIAALTSYYDTKSSRYGSQEAKKVLDTYLGSLEVKNAVFNRLQPMLKNTKVDELDKFINQARKFNPKKPTKPLLKFLKEKGGVKMDSNLAGELNALGITTKTAPGLFRKESGLGDVDNFPASEFLAKFPNSGVQVEGDYISRQAVLDLIGRELQGVDISKEISQEEEKLHQFLEDLDRIGVEIKNSDNEAVKKAIESYKQEQGYFQGGLGIIQKDQELALKSLDKFLKKHGIEAKTIQEKEKAYNNLKPSQKLELITSSINEAKINLDNYSDSKIYFQSGFGIIAADQERANAILDKFLKEEVGIEPKTPIERDEAFAKLAPSEQLKIVEKQQKEIGESLTDYFGKRLFFQGGGLIQGQTQFIGQKPIISLFKSKNRSTLLHELGHVFLQIESEVSKLPDISDQVKNDWNTVEDWLGIKDGKITSEQHEKFARGFEAYLREGRAPSIGLRNAFRKFKSWLLKIYKNVKALDVEISEPIRKVFDRMLATDEEIENLKNNPLFRADQAILDSLSEEEQKKYLALTQNAKESAKEKLLSKSLKELAKQNTKSFKEEKAKVRAELEKQLSEAPVYRALNILKSPEYKLGRGSVENYDGDFLKRLPKDIIAEDGVDVDMAADYLGFKDGGQMLNSLAEAPSFKSELKNAVDEEMAARYVEPITQEDAINASENEARAKKILYELNNANKKVHTFVDTTENYKQKAKDILAKKEIKDATQSNIYYLNEVKAAREAGIAYGAKDYTKAVEWKKKQLLNHYLYRESQKIKVEVKDFTKRAERYKRKPVVGKVLMEEDYREKIIGLLQDFGIDAKGFDYQKTNIAELENWKKEQADEGVLGLVNFSEIAEFQDKDNIRALTTEQFKTLDNAVTNLAHVGQGLRSLEIEGKRVELDAIANDIVNLVNQNIKKDKPSLEDPAALEKLKRDFDSYASSLIKTSQTTLKIDGEKHLGAFYNYFEKNVNSSELKKEGLKDQAYKKFDEIFKKHFGGYNLSKKRTYFKDIGKSYSKPAVLSFALNWGNALNRRRVMDGFEYSSSQVNSILSSLSKNELEFVQDVWDMVNSYWPQVEATQKKLFGFAPKKQGAIPFTIKSSDGHLVKMKGGYYPIAYSKEASLVSDTKEDLQQLFAASAADKISFHASYTKERSEAKISKKIELSLNPLTKHISQVITDIAMKESVWNAYKIINNRKVSAALIKKIGLADYKQLQTWLYDMYGRSLVQEGALGKLAALSRSVATTYAMGFKVSTALIQITGLTNSIVKLGYGNMGYGIWKALGNGNPVSINKAAKLAFAKSKILEDRSKTINRDIYEVMDRLQQSGKMTKAIAKFAFLATTKAQMIVDLPTWYGGYYKGLKDFNGNEDKAIELADRLVIESQGSSYKQSRSSIERNEAAIVKAFTVFYSYMNVKLNLLAGSYRKNDFKKPRDVATFASDLMLLFFVDAVATEFLREGVSNLLAGRDDEDDDEENKSLHYANLITQSAASTIPGVSQFYSGLSGYSFNPGGFKGFEIVGKGVKNLGSEAVKAISEDEEADLLKALRGLNDTLAIFSAGGGGQIDIFLRAEQEAQKGNDVAPIDYLLKAKK